MGACISRGRAAAMNGGTAFLRATSPAALLVALIAALAPAQDGTRETFTAFAVSTGGPNSNPVAEPLTFTVDRWSSDAQRQTLAEALKEKGSDGLLDALRDLPEVGHMRATASLGYPLRYADQQPLPDGGRRLVLATDRPIAFWETWSSARTLDYPFTIVEMHVDKDGKGEGKLAMATRVVTIANRIVLENWSDSPVQLTNVRMER